MGIRIYLSFQICTSPTKSTGNWGKRLPEPPIPALQEKDPSLYHIHISSDHFLNFSTNFTEKERDYLLRINVSLFEDTEIQDMMNTQITLQHLCTKFSRVSLCIHPQCIVLVHLCNYLGNAVLEVSVQENPTRNTGVLQIKIKKNTAFWLSNFGKDALLCRIRLWTNMFIVQAVTSLQKALLGSEFIF